MLPETFWIDSRLHDVRITGARLSAPEPVIDHYRAMLTRDELERAARFATPTLRERAIASRGFLRETLGQTLGVDPGSLKFELGLQGKPALANKAIQFNLSHSHDVVVVALSHSVEVGIDVEWVRPEIEPDEIARDFFTPAEREYLSCLAPAGRCREFFRIWTSKEAVAKCYGEGLTFALREVELVASQTEWSIEHWTLFTDYALGLAVRKRTDGLLSPELFSLLSRGHLAPGNNRYHASPR